MLERVVASEFLGTVGNGRTQPLHLGCDRQDGSTIEVIAKFSATCDEGVVNLAREVVAACLAGDLGLPIPTPYLVEITPEFIDVISDPGVRANVAASSSLAFGSTFITRQYSTWVTGTKISDAMTPIAAAIFAFDAIVQNPDRRDGNANCVVRGDECRIFDHELCFAHDKILFWKPPWILDGLSSLRVPGNHIFRAGLSRKRPDFSAVSDQWQRLSDERLLEYEKAIPAEWAAAGATVTAALGLVGGARDNIAGCINELERVLT